MTVAASIPSSLVAYLRAACVEFGAEDEITQLRIARLLWTCREPRRAHRRYAGCAVVSKQDLREIFGSDATARRVLAGRYFLVLRGDNLGDVGFAAAYRPAQNLLDAMDRCIRDPEPVEFLTPAGAPIAAQRGPIAPRRAGSGTAAAWAGLAPAKYVPVSEDNLLALLPVSTALLQQHVWTLVRAARNLRNPGAIAHRYVQHRSGRLFAEVPSLQSAPKPVRAAALHGFWDYDIANCHFAIFAELARRADRATPRVDAYLMDKKAMRARIAHAARITVEEAKACLIMIMYGARLAVRRKIGAGEADWAPLAIAKEIGVEAAKRLFDCMEYTALHAEVELTRTAVLSAHTGRGGFVVNKLGVAISPKERLGPARLLAHILQGCEAAALRAVVRHYGAAVVLCLHDGWVARERLNVDECEALIRDATGIPLRIEEAQLLHPMHFGPVRQVGKGEIVVEDQGIAEPDSASYATSSQLAGAPLADVHAEKPSGGLVLGMRPNWNYPKD